MEIKTQQPPVLTTVSDSSAIFLPLLPLKNVVVLPKSILPIIVGRQSSIRAVEFSLKNNKEIFISAQRNSSIEQPNAKDVYQYGVRATILQIMRMPSGSLKILVEGICRAHMLHSEDSESFTGVYCEDTPSTHTEKTPTLEAAGRTLQSLYTTYTKLNDKAPQDFINLMKKIDNLDYLTDTVAVHLNLSFHERQEILEITHLQQRIVKVCTYLEKEIEILQIEHRIRGQIQTQIEKSQREYYLTEQIKAIHKELGREDQQNEFAQLREEIKKLNLPQEAIEKVEKELKRLEQMPPLSSEAVVSRHYVDWIISIPWHKRSKDRISLIQAEQILNKHHAGLKKPKERIIEFLAAKKFSKHLERSPIICLVGPPGVGKTSLARSIAQSLGREFVRIALGGVKDEAEIRGHRRTYIGALPGKIIQAMKKASTINPVILLDEVDKMSSDLHGDPASALLEVLDPEQNVTFNDHFLDLEYNLSQVMFITTANHVDGIPYPLFDRMEMIHLSGYTNKEKFEIARKFLLPKNFKEYDLSPTQCRISDKILETVITQYTKEAGVRQLERLLTKLMRKVIQHLLKNKTVKSTTVTAKTLHEWLRHPPYKKMQLEQKASVGLATGLAWTELGGDTLEIEATVLPGKGSLTLTGQLGEVMQESAQAALSYIRSRSKELNLPKGFHSNKDIHVHLPEGATPKDGPSAGITMCVAMVSALTKNPVRSHFAMTGEITLRGRVIAIGGLKEKLLAAKQHAIKTILIPKDNKEDYEEILQEIGNDIKKSITVTYVESMDQVLSLALEKKPFGPKLRAYRTKKK